jgi:hypothetical protein
MVETVDPKELEMHPANLEIYQTRRREDDELRESIGEHGILEPLVVNSQNVIISGARRWKVALELGLKEVPYRVEDPEDEELAIIEYNRYRRKTPLELYKEYQIIKRKEGLEAEERMKAGKADLTQDVAEGSRGEVRDIAAHKLHRSHEHLRQIDYIYSRRKKEEVKPVVTKLDKGEISVHRAYEQVKKIENPQPAEPKTFRCRACMEKYTEPVNPVNVTLCPECEMQFQMWLADR